MFSMSTRWLYGCGVTVYVRDGGSSEKIDRMGRKEKRRERMRK
jgi:hypothetical protein